MISWLIALAVAAADGGTPPPPGSDFTEVVRRGSPQLRRCAETALKKAPDLRLGGMSVEIGIAATGAVTRATWKSTAGAIPKDLDACMTQAVKGWKFAPGVGTVVVSWPLNVDAAE
jgi:hypothetical protein